MALVLSPWFGRGCGRSTRFSYGGPSYFTDLVILRVPQRWACAPASANHAMPNDRVVQWAETAEEHIFKLRLPGLKKEDLHIQIEDDRTLYISYSNEGKEETTAKVSDEASTSQPKEQKSSSAACSFMRKFKVPENADLEQIKAEVTNETLTVSVPKRRQMKSAPEIRKIHVSEGGHSPVEAATTSPPTLDSTPSNGGKPADASRQKSKDPNSTSTADQPSTSTAS